MARLFTLNFEFKNTPCVAIVTFQKGAEDTFFKVAVYDEAMQYILPDGRLSFTAIEPEKINPANAAFDDLRSCVYTVISSYLKAAQE